MDCITRKDDDKSLWRKSAEFLPRSNKWERSKWERPNCIGQNLKNKIENRWWAVTILTVTMVTRPVVSVFFVFVPDSEGVITGCTAVSWWIIYTVFLLTFHELHWFEFYVSRPGSKVLWVNWNIWCSESRWGYRQHQYGAWFFVYQYFVWLFHVANWDKKVITNGGQWF